MRNLAVVVIVVAVAGLGCDAASGGDKKLDEALAKLETFKSEMCACKTKKCADKVDDSFEEWRTKSKDELGKVSTTVEKLEAYKSKSKTLEASIEECHAARADKLAVVLDEMRQLKSDACRCKANDVACADKMKSTIDDWEHRVEESMSADDKAKLISKENLEKLDKLDHDIKECLRTARGDAGGPGSGDLAITSLSPETGDANGGTYVVIKGRGFTSPVRNAKVYFGSGSDARQGQVIRFQSDGELIIQAPGGKPDEIVDVLVTFEPGGVLKLPKAFKFVDKDPAGPTVDDVTKP